MVGESPCPPQTLPRGTVRMSLGFPFSGLLRASCLDVLPIVRSLASPGEIPGRQFLRIVRLQEPDEQQVGVLPFERDQSSAVADWPGNAVEGDLAGAPPWRR